MKNDMVTGGGTVEACERAQLFGPGLRESWQKRSSKQLTFAG